MSRQSEESERYIIGAALKMKPGESIRIGRHQFNEAFCPSLLASFFDSRPSEDRLLEHLPGVNYGAYELHKDLITGDYTLFRYECGTERVREDWDRRNKK